MQTATPADLGLTLRAALCDASRVNREAIVAALRDMGLSALVPFLDTVRSAMCGDADAESQIEAAAAGCGCTACRAGGGPGVVTTLKAACAGGSCSTTSGRLARMGAIQSLAGNFIAGGETGRSFGGAAPPASLPCDWNCRTSLGDVSACELDRYRVDEWPNFQGTMVPFTPTTKNIPPPPVGTGYYVLELGPTLPVSRQLCLNGLTIRTTAGVATSPIRIALQAEIVVCKGDGETVHAYDNPKWAPPNGWEIADGRCRCNPPPCVCVPPGGRVRVLVLMPDLVTWNASIDLWQDPAQVGVIVCGACPPPSICDREEIPRCACLVASPGTGGAPAPASPTETIERSIEIANDVAEELAALRALLTARGILEV